MGPPEDMNYLSEFDWMLIIAKLNKYEYNTKEYNAWGR